MDLSFNVVKYEGRNINNDQALLNFSLFDKSNIHLHIPNRLTFLPNIFLYPVSSL